MFRELLVLAAAGTTWACVPTAAHPGKPAPAPALISALTKCQTCHERGRGVGVPIDAETAPALAGLIYERVHSGSMPPWVPSSASPPYVDDFSLNDVERNALEQWAAEGAQMPDGALLEGVNLLPARPPELIQAMPEAHQVAPSPAGDEYRCFVLPSPALAVTIAAYAWQLGRPSSAHHVTGLVLSPAGAVRGRSLEWRDGRPGFDCVTIPQGLDVVAELGAAGVGPAGGQTFPSGVGATVPAGGAILMQLHYTGPAAQGDRSGIQIWTTADLVQPLRQFALWAPVELPCPTGVKSDPKNPCSREHGLQLGGIQSPAEVRAQEDYVLNACGTTLAKMQQLTYVASTPEHFFVETECTGELPAEGTLYFIHGHMHTRGTSLRAEIEGEQGWLPLLDINQWRWWWERAYAFATPIPVRAGQRIRVKCTHDNGSVAQWSAETNSPGTDSPARAPRQDPHYVTMGLDRNSDMCEVFAGWAPMVPSR